jgi:hypothetical protein
VRPGIEHAQALRHVVERQGELPDPCLHASADQTGNDEEERCDGKTGGLPVRHEQGKRLGHNFFRRPEWAAVLRHRIAVWLINRNCSAPGAPVLPLQSNPTLND